MSSKVPLAILTDSRFELHLTGQGHPESPARTQSIQRVIDRQGYIQPQNSLSAREATDNEILLCHTSNYLQLVKEEIKNCRLSPWQDGSSTLSTGDVQICPVSLEIARLAVGSALVAVDAVMQEKATAAFCAVRPPGHHACSNIGRR